jgi:hypothetical protein
MLSFGLPLLCSSMAGITSCAAASVNLNDGGTPSPWIWCSPTSELSRLRLTRLRSFGYST